MTAPIAGECQSDHGNRGARWGWNEHEAWGETSHRIVRDGLFMLEKPRDEALTGHFKEVTRARDRGRPDGARLRRRAGGRFVTLQGVRQHRGVIIVSPHSTAVRPHVPPRQPSH